MIALNIDINSFSSIFPFTAANVTVSKLQSPSTNSL